MKLKELTSQDIFYIRKIHGEVGMSWDTRMTVLMERFGKSERTIRRWIKKLGISSVTPSQDPQQITEAKNRKLKSSKYHIISWAQNATPVHTPLLNNILTYAGYLGAEVHIIPGRYKNPTSVFTDKNMDWWDESLSDFLVANRIDLNSSISILADIKVQPTATNPLTGFEGITGSSSTIIGHPRIHMTSLPVLEGYPCKFMFTTGAVTLPNYTDSRAGKSAEFHHIYGFIIVEIVNDDTFYVRQVTSMPDGSFCDLMNHISNSTITQIPHVDAFVMGDLHVASMDVPLFDATLSYLKILKPKKIVLHDVFDGQSISHHERNNPVKVFQKMQQGRHLVDKEIEDSLDLIGSLLQYNPVVVRSNHHDWLDRWVADQDWKKELHNSLSYLKYTHVALSGLAPKGIFSYLVNERFGDSVVCLGPNDSYRINGWEVANHGDKGANGSKGNIEQFRKMNTKVILGDWHSAKRKEGALSVGTHSVLRTSYNIGPSSWNQADVIIHPNGKAQHLIYFNNKFTTLLDG